MESSDDLGEECSSSESGWTMYIASPMHDNTNHDDDHHDNDDHDDDDGYDDGDEKKKLKDECDYSGNRKEEEGSDDSMASDASSGPSQHQMVLHDFKNAKGNQQRKSSGKSPQKKAEKSKSSRKMKPEKDIARTGAKARKPQ